MSIKTVEAEYIEHGTFQGGEEDASVANISTGETVIVIKKKDYEKLVEKAWRYDDLCK